MFYIAVVNGSQFKFAEHYEERVGFDRRAMGLKNEAIIQGDGWQLYGAEEPYECALIRQNLKLNEGEAPEDFQTRLNGAVQTALQSTASILKPTMPDDSKLDNPDEIA